MSSTAATAEIVRLYLAGDWVCAEGACKAILARDPRMPVPLIVAGEIAMMRGDAATARSRLRRAARLAITDKALLTNLVGLLDKLGEYRAVVEPLKSLLRIDPKNFSGHFLLGRISQELGRVEEAVSAYEAARALMPGHAGPDTARAILLLRRAWGEPLAAPPEKRQPQVGPGRIAMTTLGQNGRFGNQIFQYCFLRIYGGIHRLQMEIPEWVGCWLFDLDDLPPPRASEHPFRASRRRRS